MKLHDVEIDERDLTTFCRANAIRELLFFGSITRDDFRPDSDVDVIVNFEPGRTPDLFTFAGLQLELTQMLGRQVHLHTDGMIHERRRRSGALRLPHMPPERHDISGADIDRLEHILEAACDLGAFVQGRRRDELDSDPMLRRAILHAILVIGEAAARTSAQARALLPALEWGKIVATRNILVHVYGASTTTLFGSSRRNGRLNSWPRYAPC